MSARSRLAPWFRVPGERLTRECADLRAAETEAGRVWRFRHSAWRRLAYRYYFLGIPNVDGTERFYRYLEGLQRAVLEASKS
jgi:hypothetical protein